MLRRSLRRTWSTPGPTCGGYPGLPYFALHLGVLSSLGKTNFFSIVLQARRKCSERLSSQWTWGKEGAPVEREGRESAVQLPGNNWDLSTLFYLDSFFLPP